MRPELLPSIQRARLAINHEGFLLVEVMLASAVFVLLIIALVGAYLYGQEAIVLAGNRVRAVMLAEEGLEAARTIKNAQFGNLIDGTYGLVISNNIWILSGSTDTSDIFTRSLTISSADDERKNVVATVTWQQNAQRTGTVALTTKFTNWRKNTAAPASCNDYVVQQGYRTGTCRQNTQQCANNSETYLPDGDVICVTNFPSDSSHDTCCALPY